MTSERPRDLPAMMELWLLAATGKCLHVHFDNRKRQVWLGIGEGNGSYVAGNFTVRSFLRLSLVWSWKAARKAVVWHWRDMVKAVLADGYKLYCIILVSVGLTMAYFAP